MIFNEYIWNLYKQSTEGIETIDLFEKMDIEIISKRFNLPIWYLTEKTKQSFIDCNLTKYFTIQTAEGQFINNIDFLKDFFQIFHSKDDQQTINLFEQTIEAGVKFKTINNEPFFWIPEKDYDGWWFEDLPNISTALYLVNPEFFIPYYFICEFDKLTKIFEAFNIPLPELPKKSDKRNRLLYYLKICQTLQEFRHFNNFKSSELCAFIYSFAKTYIKSKESNEMPKPSKVWFVGGGKNNNGDFEYLDNADENSVEMWQASAETRKGDIIVMYCLTPRSYIHSIWRANCDGFNDPFFYFYNTVFITKPIKTTQITQQELKANPIFSKNPLVRKNMQGINGYGITVDEYSELLELMESKGQNTSILPKIEIIENIKNITLEDERDVEIYLVEPLLERIEYDKTDYIRQMPIKMGRGERYYPDYCFGANSKRGEEKAKMVLETKYSIRNNKELQDAYYQAKSYALRLQTKCLVLASKEGIWIFFQNKTDFDFNSFIFNNWNELNNPDKFHVILKKIGKKTIFQN